MRSLLGLLKSGTIRDTLISFVGLGTTAVLGFVFTVIMARTLGPAGFGVFSAVTALATIIYSLGDVGIPPALINFLPKLPGKEKPLLSTAFSIQLLVCCVAVVVFLILTVFHSTIIPGSLPIYLLLALALSINYILVGFAQGIFTAKRRFWRYSMSQVIDAVIKITLVLVLLVTSRLSISSALAANVISSLIALFITFGKQMLSIKLEIQSGIFDQIFAFAKWIAVSRVFSVFLGRIDILLLNLISSGFTAGIYAAANRITLLFALMISSLNVVVNPRFSSFKTNEETLSYIKKLFFLILGVAILMMVCVIFAGPIINLVFGAKYSNAISVFRWLTLAMLPFLFSLITTPALIYRYNEPDFYAKITAMQITAIVALDLILIPTFGYFAPVIATAASNLMVMFLSFYELYRLLRVK